MATAPTVYTSDSLSQRQSRPFVMVSPEEYLKQRISAYTKSDSELGFMVRQPSSAAILKNYVELELTLQFTVHDEDITKAFSAHRTTTNSTGDTTIHPDAGAANQAYGIYPEGYPFQTKCVRVATITTNGASQTYRPNMYMYEYLKLHASRSYMEKTGYGLNEHREQYLYSRSPHADGGYVGKDGAFAGLGASGTRIRVVSSSEAYQNEIWEENMSANGKIATPARQTVQMTFREPLVIGQFGGLGQMSAFPAWSCESNKSPSLLHINTQQITFNMEDNWSQNMFLMIQGAAGGGAQQQVLQAVTVVDAHLNLTWCSPPPKMVPAALSQQVSYATFDAIRFKAECNALAELRPKGTTEFTLRQSTFPYMPSIFIFSIAPDYNRKSPWFAGPSQDPTIPKRMRLDRRLSITHMNLVLNTSSDAMPHLGASAANNQANAVKVRYNQRQLYRMWLDNCSSYELCPYTFQEWKKMGFVAISSDQFSGITNSPHIRGQITLNGTIFCENNMGYACSVKNTWVAGDTFNFGDDEAGHGVNGTPYKHFRANVIAIFSNKALVLDSKAGLLQESVYSSQVNESLRLNNSQ